MSSKTVSVTMSNGDVKVYNDVTSIDLRDTSIFTIKYTSEEKKRNIALLALPVVNAPDALYAKSLTINFTE